MFRVSFCAKAEGFGFQDFVGLGLTLWGLGDYGPCGFGG